MLIWDRHNCHVSGVVRWANDKDKKCLCDLAELSLMLSARVCDLECIRNGGTQVQRRSDDGNSINKANETKRSKQNEIV
jgi:hypothetical protein